MKKNLLKYLLLLLFVLAFLSSKAQTDWKGATSNNWATPSNWSNGVVPTATSQARIGVVAFTNQPVISTVVPNVGSLILGPIKSSLLGAPDKTITINTGQSLTVVGDITQNHPTTNVISKSTINGGGTLTCQNLNIGNTNVPADFTTLTLDSTVVSSLVGTFKILGNINLLSNASVDGNVVYFPDFNLDANNVILSGSIVTSNNANAASAAYLSLLLYRGRINANNSNNINSLTLSNLSPIALPVATNQVIDLNTAGSTSGKIIFNALGNGQKIYTSADTYIGRAGGNYQNITFSGGSKSVDGGTMTVSGDIDNSAGALINFAANSTTVQMIGTGTQTISGGNTLNTLYTSNPTGNPTGTVFYNLMLSNTTALAPTVRLLGNNNIAALGTISFTTSTTLNAGTVGTANTLTLLSNPAGDASIGDLTNGGTILGNVSGTINVQRYMKGGTAIGLNNGRGYRFISSPVANTTGPGTILAYNLIPLKVNTLITGPAGGSFNATPSGTPSVFMYNENAIAPAPSPNTSIQASDYKGFGSISEYVPMGNGMLFYFRGNQNVIKNYVSTAGSGNAFNAPFPPAENTTLNFFGQVLPNTGITVQVPKFNAGYPDLYRSTTTNGVTTVTFSTALSYSGAAAKKGFNVMGNPYPSAIDLQAFYNANNNATTGVTKFMYMLVRSNTSYATSFATYDAVANSAQTGASRYALSGQGFFVQANSASSVVNFTETMKAAYPTGTTPNNPPSIFSLKNVNLLSSTKEATGTALASAAVSNINTDATGGDVLSSPFLRLQLRQDTIVFNETDFRFISGANEKFSMINDAFYIGSSGQTNKLYSVTPDSIKCFVKYAPAIEKNKKIDLGVSFGDSGLYTIAAPIKTNFPPQYVIYLVDTYLKDSLDVTHNPTYNFRVDKGVAATYAADRFYLSVNKVPGYEYRLLDFAGNKVTEGVKLNWKTEFEGDYTGFDVERSIDGEKSFIYLGVVRSSGVGTYAFTDRNPQIGTNLYRLKQTDINNNNVYSKIVTIEYQIDNSLLPGFMVYPSTATQDITISFGKTYNNNIKVTLSNTLGNIVKTFKTSATDKILSQVSTLPVGVYIVTAVDESTGKLIGTSKFVKQ